MEWYTLDDSFRKDTVIEGFESFIWAERYSKSGDFQIVIKSTPSTRLLLNEDTYVAKKESTYTGKIETVEDVVDDDGSRKLKISGRFIEGVWLDDRVLVPGLGGIYHLTGFPVYAATGSPTNIMRNLFTYICVGPPPANSPYDTIPFYHSGTLLPAGTIPEPPSITELDIELDTLYNAFVKIAEAYIIGFRFVRNGDLGQVYFEVYMGNDRTSGQTVRTPVIFSPDMENLGKTSILKSSGLIKTVAYVYATNGSMMVYPGATDTSTGDKRRVLFVKADNINDAAGSGLNAKMQQRGLDELAKWRRVYAFDGELPQVLPYDYGTDYGLGDLVEERSADGIKNTMVVTEQIFISDKEGERSYPTLTLYSSLIPGWSGLPIGEFWTDIPAETYWTDL